MTNELHSAIIGCGTISKVHAAALAKVGGTRLTACADINTKRAEALGAQYGARAYASLDALLANEHVDVVHLCTPHYLHSDMAEACAKRGLSVFSEKPPCMSRAQWAALERTAKEARVGVCFQNRYNPCVRRVRELLASGAAGRVRGARAFVTWCRQAPYYSESGWRGEFATEGGGALINQSIHTLDLLVYLLGKPEGVETVMRNHHLKGVIAVEDTVEAYIRFPGASALLYATTAYSSDAPVYIELDCENMTISLTGDELALRYPDGSREHPEFPREEALGKGYWGNGHLPCIRDFYRAVREGAPAPLGVQHVRDTIALMLTMYEQGREQL